MIDPQEVTFAFVGNHIGNHETEEKWRCRWWQHATYCTIQSL